jgi:hypothetical protein
LKHTSLIFLLVSFVLASCSLAAPIATPTAEATVIPTVTSTPTTVPTPTEVPLASLSAGQLVEKYLAEREIDTSTLSIQQRAAFSEALVEKLEAERGQQPIWVEAEDATGKVTLYHDVAQNKMVTLPGSYADNKDVIDQNSYRMFVAISEEEGTGNLQYIHPDTGEKMTLPDSAGIDWTKIIDKTNLYDGYMKLPTGEALAQMEKEIFGKSTDSLNRDKYIQAILMNQEPIILTRAQGLYWDEYCLNALFMRTDQSGKPLYAVRVFVGPIGVFGLMKEKGKDLERIHPVIDSDFEKFTANHAYFLGVMLDQPYVWKNNKQAQIDQLENTSSTAQAFDAAINDPFPEVGNIILEIQCLVERN